jgi:uncharacterized protein with HEPN domain
MPPEEADRDLALLVDMLNAARECSGYTQQVDFAAFEQDRMRVRAVERMLEIIGEAARGLSDQLRQQFPQTPWRLIVGQRNFIAHVYDAVDDKRLWDVARNRLPPLIAELEAMVAQLSKDIR